MDQYPIYQTLIIDPLPYAWCIEATHGNYLMPSARKRGVWFPHRTTPDEVPAFLFYKPDSNLPQWQNMEVTAESLGSKDIPGDLCDGAGKVIIPAEVRHRMSKRPVLPLTGLRMVRAAIDDKIAEMSKCWSRRHQRGLEELWKEFLDPRLTDIVPPPGLSEDDYLAAREKLIDRRDEVIAEIRDCLAEPLQQVREFIGTSERDRWTMHFLRLVGNDLQIQKSEDYRIFDWERRMESGDWV